MSLEITENKKTAIKYYNYIYEFCYGIKNTEHEFKNSYFGENNIVACAVEVAHYNDCDVDIVTHNYNDWKKENK